MKRLIQTTLPQTLPTWLQWSAWEAERTKATDEPPAAKPKRKREKPVWRETTELEQRAIVAYRRCHTPPYSFDRRLCRQIAEDKITDKIATWLWFYAWKHRAQIGDVAVVREAAKRKVKECPSEPSTK